MSRTGKVLFVSSPIRLIRLSRTGNVVCIESDKTEKFVEDRLCCFVSRPIRLRRLSRTGNVCLYRVCKAEEIVEDR